ncbi:T9SS type A sorting domain-containing protein [Rubrivirga sp.]|uniref:T9SS type A sorting domain-containing protein n=1 Tax=Rubrivirga sp. TaxID=1885344 RepID=UPI003B524D52
MRRSLLLALVAPLAVAAQPSAPDLCETGQAEAFLDVAGVRAALYNTGGLFWRGSEAVYEVPKRSGVGAIFSGGLWVGGVVGGDLRFAGSTYGPWEFWPGPLDAGGATTAERCATFDRIWTVRTADLDAYDATGAATADLAEWPVAWGAPFYHDADGDGRQSEAEPTVSLDLGDPGYGTKGLDLAAGERPVVFGRQTAWWVMNDAGGEHEWSGGEPLQVEVRATAWLLGDPDTPDLIESSFYRYEILNRSDAVVEDTFVGLFTDGDLGNFNDDYVGSDSTRSMLYFYNGDNDDEGMGGYGVPPALGIDVLSGGYAAMYFTSGGAVTSGPNRSGEEAYTYMRARWKDGTPLRVGGDGYNTNGPVTRWVFSGDPPDFWSEVSADENGTSNTPADRRAMISARVGRLEPGARATVDVAILFAQGVHRFASVRRLQQVSDLAQRRYEAGTLMALVETPSAPASAPALVAPADGATFADGPVTFTWEPVDLATDYRLDLGTTPAFEDSLSVFASGASLDLARDDLPVNGEAPLYWRVVPFNLGVEGPASETRAFVYPLFGPRRLSNGAFAFVEVVGPGGTDPCGPEAVSTFGCDEVGGNAVYSSLNSTGAYLGTSFTFGTTVGTEGSIGDFAPSDFEIRFTEDGSYAYNSFSNGSLLRVPFEVWDIGLTRPFETNDPADDVRLIPLLLATGEIECAFGYSGPSQLGVGPITQRVYAYYPVGDDYGAFEAVAAPLVAAHPDGCPATDAAYGLIDFDRGRPIQRFVLEQADESVGVEALTGTVIRFYTTDPAPVAADGDRPGALRLSVHPNPVGGRATVPFALAAAGPARVRVVDVLGREVAVLADGPHAAGEHSVGLDGGRLAAGVYVVVLDAGGQRATQTVTVVR